MQAFFKEERKLTEIRMGKIGIAYLGTLRELMHGTGVVVQVIGTGWFLCRGSVGGYGMFARSQFCRQMKAYKKTLMALLRRMGRVAHYAVGSSIIPRLFVRDLDVGRY
jgi:hypothetical protein